MQTTVDRINDSFHSKLPKVLVLFTIEVTEVPSGTTRKVGEAVPILKVIEH